MKATWRWFGPSDPVTLADARQAGAAGIVSSLHHIPDGEAWSEDEVQRHAETIGAAGFRWDVVESIPVSNEIKVRGPDRRRHIDNYKTSIASVGAAGIGVVCYNFIPVIDWARTDLRYPLPSGLALRFDLADFAACDLFLLRRKNAAAAYDAPMLAEAERRFRAMSPERRAALEATVFAPLPGGTVAYSSQEFAATFARYEDINEDDYRETLLEFLREVVPVAEEHGVRLCIHPDDPPINLFGLPRIAGSIAQLRRIVSGVRSPSNGVTFCVGSLGVRSENDLPAMVRELGPDIHFAHLRNVMRESDTVFHEAEHLGGSSDMAAVVFALRREELRRKIEGRRDDQIPFRPDHGHLMLDDVAKADTRPGYSAIGRLKGLAELRGVISGFDLAVEQGLRV
ncbi:MULTISPECIES: mannonate dehydratase [unclassified Chelatococcus]|uniref:mannonate dehydratase n=1 Tax=unclassified Chelatococcus TaxID=2638111 RepID=UPI001BCD6D34|nr:MULTISPECIES: mannonate dehydratase [unclassified Chelatococcus]CAH1649396.1 Mannonate dehydratase [Hyphomicrobiales bacterium]MBS7741770.1 mannonate dehydratase [Chelatococcus sp. HY11]MBX3541432.1 mannonate dehydratase [Chelatococcus sp.]MCO5074674.1 mannonate dehydratase [Chelatococcus sp.]CAH1691918.1 Mannonate dehydratase [Hyphomicrobiales bacterium]